MLKSTRALIIPALAAALAAQSSVAAPQVVKITLLGLNDLHGNIEEKSVAVGAAPATKSVTVGGAGIMASYFDIARKKNPGGVLVLDSGDAYQGTLISNYFEGASVVAGYNALKIDASTFGNHEFDYGDHNDNHSTVVDNQGAMKKLLTQAQFKYLSANLVTTGSKTLQGFANVAAGKLFRRNGVTIGVVGATTETTPREAAPASVKGLEFKNMAKSVAAVSKALRKAGAQVVVLIAHAGGICDMTQAKENTPGDEACKQAQPDEITAMLDAMPAGTLDAVMAGHVHTVQAHYIRGIPVVQTFGFGNSFSRIDLWVNKAAKASAPAAERIVRRAISKPTYFCHTHFANYASCSPEEAKLGGKYPADFGGTVPATYLGEDVKPVAAVAEALAPYQAKTKALIEKHIVDLPSDLAYDRMTESQISNCVADAVKEQLEFERGEKFDLFVSHSGGVRSRLPKNVRYGDVFAVLPFDGSMGIAKLNGKELEDFGKYQSLTPKSIAVISEGGWKVKLAKDGDYPRHRGFVTPQGDTVKSGQLYSIVTEGFNVAPGNPGTDALLAEARKAGRIEILMDLKDVSRELMARRLSRAEPLPKSCLGGPTDRTIFVDATTPAVNP